MSTKARSKFISLWANIELDGPLRAARFCERLVQSNVAIVIDL